VSTFKAAVEAIVPLASVAIAVARLLMQNDRNLRRQFVGVRLIRILGVLHRKLFFA
jgi:hypothetical protein